MAVPPKTDPCWRRLLTMPTVPEFTSLATKLTVGRLRLAVKQEPTAIPAAIEELSGFFGKNAFAARDLSLV